MTHPAEKDAGCVECGGVIDRTIPAPIPEGYELMLTEALSGRALYCLACYSDIPPAVPMPDAEKVARMLRLPAADEHVSHLHMRAVAALIEQWEEDDADSDDYTRGQAAEDLRRVIAGACTCRARPHDRRCPTRVLSPVVGAP